MTAPLLWIGLPVISGTAFLAMSRWRTVATALALLFSLGLAALSWWLPVGEAVTVGNHSLLVEEQFTVAGTILMITNAERLVLAVLYGVLALILVGGLAADVEGDFVPLGFFLVACATAALAIKPVFLGAIFIEVGALISVFALTPTRRSTPKGVLRFLTYQTIGVAFLLLSSGALENEEFSANPATFLAFGVGMACVMAVFPLHTWIPMLMEETPPYRAVAVLLLHGGVVAVFLYGVLDRIAVLGAPLTMEGAFRAVGTLLVVSGGAWAAFQRHLGRILGFAIIIAIGLGLESLGLPAAGLQAGLWVPMLVAFIVWGLALAEMDKRAKSLRFGDTQGLARAFPITAAACLAANFSLAGMPLLAGFPLWMAFWKKMVVLSPSLALWNYLGSMGLMAGGLRTFAVLVMGPKDLDFQGKEGVFLRWLLLAGLGFLFLSGLFPDKWSNLLLVMAERLGSQAH